MYWNSTGTLYLTFKCHKNRPLLELTDYLQFLFIYSFNKYMLSSTMSETVLDPGDIRLKKDKVSVLDDDIVYRGRQTMK